MQLSRFYPVQQFQAFAVERVSLREISLCDREACQSNQSLCAAGAVGQRLESCRALLKQGARSRPFVRGEGDLAQQA